MIAYYRTFFGPRKKRLRFMIERTQIMWPILVHTLFFCLLSVYKLWSSHLDKHMNLLSIWISFLALQYHILINKKFCFHLVKQQKWYIIELQMTLIFLLRRINALSSFICLEKWLNLIAKIRLVFQRHLWSL